ncbi:unnamed protein product [Zymoseptoria tritici ST99CH_1A5]|uniref:Uncharacterized protein n=3 Tax=Zymoseptoria tritici TaxID=1047171 RepID=A0A1X7S6P0_ZYMT9|nr:unnamed protein product [Zymoseptoria tritici ST99CH_3D7]SMR60291.1 unnamed protein product [Zymoseptoria tritici ST99CH_1E4]SMR63402.1 unnamed protein product [Zymoseptoria tritici ST99CH_3D1]SMY28746.1 unnamed protein product [Zymoseptoria tritici ST99CH_1A5]
MCKTIFWKDDSCGHSWLELDKPCAPGLNLVSCPDFSTTQPFGPARKPRRCRWAARLECPACDFDEYDMRKRRMIVVKRTGWKFGLGPGKEDVGVELVTGHGGVGRFETGGGCCVVM